ncbi:MAG: VWA domain-containing protein [Polyangiaceae bacterium]
MKLWVRILILFAAIVVAVGGALAYPLAKHMTDLQDAEWQTLEQSKALFGDFAWVLFGVAFLIPVLVLVWTTFLQDKRRPRIKVGTVAALTHGPRGIRPYLRDVPGVLRATALVFLIASLLRPVNIVADDTTDDKGIDIVITMDLSDSMRAVYDGDPAEVPGLGKLKNGEKLSRLETEKAVVKDFISRRRTDRIGVVVFGRKPYVLSPPTLDYHLLTSLVSRLTVNVADNSGTAIGDALMTSIARLRKSDAQTKVIIMLTDGDNNAGKVAPEKAADIAKKNNVKVFPIQIGNENDVEFPGEPDINGEPTYTKERFPVNPELLRKIADITGGNSYVANDSKELVDTMHSVLDQFDKTRFEDAGKTSYEDLFPILLLPGVALVGLEILLRALLLRRFP